MQSKMIVIDLDGTLLNINYGYSKKTEKYLTKLKNLGYIITIASGRTLKSILDITNGAKFANYIIANAGALIYNVDNHQIIYKNMIDKQTALNLLNYYNEEIDFINFCDYFYYNRYKGPTKINLSEEKIIKTKEELLNLEDIFHITIKFKNPNEDLINKYKNILSKENIDILIMQDSFANTKWLEIFSKGISKYNAINKIANIENINNEFIIAFGDSLNDIDMLSRVGISVAMENALTEVKESSTYITTSHNNDGVIYFLNNYLSKNNLIN